MVTQGYEHPASARLPSTKEADCIMAKNRKSAARSGSFSRPPSISQMMAKPNIWGDWLPVEEIGPMSWAHLAALLLRCLPPERMIEALAPVLAEIRKTTEEDLVREFDDQPLRFEEYCGAFEASCCSLIGPALAGLDGSEDIRWFAEKVGQQPVLETSLLWFVLGGIAQAHCAGSLDRAKVSEEARWLAEIRWVYPDDYSNFEVLLEELYDAFQQRFPERAEIRTFEDDRTPERRDPFSRND